MAAITVDLSRMPLRTREILRQTLSDRNAAKLAIAQANQARLAQLYRSAAGPGVSKPRFGPIDMAIDPYLAEYFSRTCADRELVWNDPEFIEWIKKNDERMAVPHSPTKIQVGYR